MVVIVENGSGVVGANSNVSVAFVTAYLADRNRVTENGWAASSAAAEDAAVVEATDYIEARFRDLFNGNKEHRDLRLARATLEFTAQPVNTETVTVGAIVYRFVTTLAAANDVQISTVSLSESIDNLVAAILATSDGAGVAYEATTVENADASAQAFYDDSMLVFAKATGTAGNAVVTTTTVTGASWNFATLNGGSDLISPQPLSFPRVSLFDRDGNQIIGMPQRLLFATAEYSVRARKSDTVLAPDPTLDALGGTVTRLKKKVGPIEKETEYLPGTANAGALPAYPAADRILRDFTRRAGVVSR